MTRSTVNPTRYRALRVGLVLVAGCAAGGAVIAYQASASSMDWMVFAVGAAIAVLLRARAPHAYRDGNRQALDRLAQAAVAMGALLVLQRVAWDFWGPQVDDPSRNLFRVSLAFMPFLCLAAIVVLQDARLALRLSWVMCAVTALIVLPALYLHTHFGFARAGMTSVLVWLLFANPLFILLMTALPQYQEQLDQSAAEISQMRDRTGLMDQLAESERRFNLVVESLDVGVWDRWVGPPERRWWSPRFYELLGYTPEELPATEDHLKSLLHPDERDAVWKKGAEQLRAGVIMNIDFRMKTKHRGYRWFNSHAKADRDAIGRMLRMAGSLTDIHEQRTAHDALRMAQTELTRLAYRDTLTDQYNRRYFDEHFQREWDRARRTRDPLALMVIDLDHFKAYNDHYGHPEGDRCLVQVARLLASAAGRAADIVARIGGEEFGVLLPGTSAAGAEEVAQRIRAQLKEAVIPHEGAPLKVVTLSIGVAATSEHEGLAPADLLDQADKALYEVKRRGRDGVLIYDESMRSGNFTAAKGVAR